MSVEYKLQGTINLGLCCIVNSLRKYKDKNGKKIEIFTGRTINNKLYFTVEKAMQKALMNINDIPLLIDYCVENKIKCFRLGSDIFPRYGDPNVMAYTMDFAKELMCRVGKYINSKNVRTLFHPCQIINIASPSTDVYDNSVSILQYHADILDNLQQGKNSVLIVHIGGRYNDKNKTIQTFIERCNKLPESIKSRLVIENCERGYNIRDCLNISKETNLSVVFDWHHYECYNLIYPKEFNEKPKDFLDEVIKSWSLKTSENMNGNNKIPIMHISNQKPKAKIGAHADYITTFPTELFEYLTEKEITIHLEVEAKAKEDAIFELRKLYPELLN
jgi:UV DNA damage endonuclease